MRVYDSEGAVYMEFSSDCRAARRGEAEAFAAHVASEIGIEWGCNYPD